MGLDNIATHGNLPTSNWVGPSQMEAVLVIDRDTTTRALRGRCSTAAIVIGLAALGATPAWADCAPDPVPLDGTVQCTGTDGNGIVVGKRSRVNVQAGADVFDLRATNIANPGVSLIDLTVSGALHGVTADNGDGIGLPFELETRLRIVVNPGGTIDGKGIKAVSTPGTEANTSGVQIDLTNAGLITIDPSYGGFALYAQNQNARFGSIVNEAGGTIRGIAGYFFGVSNAGLIEDAGFNAILGTGNVANLGTIRARGPFSTVEFRDGFFPYGLSNRGTISNAGIGVAISADRQLAVTNDVGGLIESAGSYGISGISDLSVINHGTISGQGYGAYASGGLSLNNYGTIRGSVGSFGQTLGATTISNSTIYLARGSAITGDLLLGFGDDVLRTFFGESANPFNVGGRISGGGGFNRFDLLFDRDVQLASPIARPADFQLFDFVTLNGATVELTPGFTSAYGLRVRNDPFPFGQRGTFTNSASLTIGGTAIDTTGNLGELGLINRGSIVSTLANPNNAAVALWAGVAFDNSGSIQANGGVGVTALVPSPTLANSGSITSTGDGVQATALINSGTITSSAGYGARFSNVFNTGRIEGAQGGVSNSSLSNSGTVASANYGFVLGDGFGFDNLAGGTISGGVAAIGGCEAFCRVFLTNRGTIQGNVDLVTGNGYANYLGLSDVVLLPGSTLNGNLLLGGASFATNLINTGPGAFAGVTGTVTTTPGALLRYLVVGAKSATVAPIGTFGSKVIDIGSSGVLQMNGLLASAGEPLRLTGYGTAVNNVARSGNGSIPLFDLSEMSRWQGLDPNETAGPGLILVNKAALTITRTAFGQAAAGIASTINGARFVNDGTITVRDQLPAGAVPTLSAIAGLATNNGTISVGGAAAFDTRNIAPNGLSVLNTGSIFQLAGAAPGVGVAFGGGLFDNSGRVSVAGNAVLAGDATIPGVGTIYNSGTLESTGAQAILASDPSILAVFNRVGGIIRSPNGVDAIRLGNFSTLDNAGTIRGDVVYTGSGIYVSNGGTLTGALRFGAGDDGFVYQGGSVSGAIDGGIGYDTVRVIANAIRNQKFDLKAFRGFEQVDLVGEGLIQLLNLPQLARLTLSDADFSITPDQTIQLSSGFDQRSGRTTVNGKLIAPTVQINGGVLTGSGRIQSADVAFYGGVLTPGGDGKIGQVTVDGSFNIGTATMLFDIGSTSNDQLTVLNGAFFAGAGSTLVLKPSGLGPRAGRSYKIVTAASVFGVFDSVSGTMGVLTPVISYGNNDVTVRYQAGSLAANLQIAATPVEMAFASTLDELRTSNYNSLYNLYGAIDIMDPARLSATLRGLNPTIVSESASLGRLQTDEMNALISGRLSRLGTAQTSGGRLDIVGSPGTLAQLASGSPVNSEAVAQRGFVRSLTPSSSLTGALPESMSGFIAGNVERRRVANGDGAARGISERADWNFAMGLESAMSKRLTFGSAAGFAQGRANLAGAETAVRTSQAAIYANYRLSPRAYVAGLATVAESRIGVERSAFNGESLSLLSGEASALSYTAHAEIGINLGVARGLRLTPHAALRYTSFKMDRLRETGGELALRLSDIGEERLEGRAGFALEGTHRSLSGWSVSPQLSAECVKRISGDGGSVTARFDVADAVEFQLPFGSRDGSWSEFKAGFSFVNGPVSFGAGFETSFGRSEFRDDRAVANVAFNF